MSPLDYSLSREEAAEALRVSVRTIDRYLRRHYFDCKRSGRQVWISRPSFEGFFEVQTQEQESTKFLDDAEVSESDLSGAPSTRRKATARLDAASKAPPAADLNPAPHHPPLQTDFTPHVRPHSYEHDLSPSQIYKTLYDELKTQHDEQVKRLEGAHYRVGQLEAQVKGMVPMGEFKKQGKQLLLMNDQYKATVQEAQQKLSRAKRIIEGERLNKNVYLSLVYALLALHIVFWLLLR